MLKNLICGLVIVVCGLANAAFAEPVVLKLNFWGGPDESLYTKLFTPFAAAVNAEAPDLLKIELYHTGALGRNPTQQAQLLLDKVFDIGFIVPGLMPGRFTNNQGIELPALFADATQATRVREILLAEKKLMGYDEYHVLGIAGVPPLSLFTRTKIAKIQDLKGLKIRAANTSDTEFLKALQAVPVFMPATETIEALSRRTVDGTSANPQGAEDFGFHRVTNSVFYSKGSATTLAFMMTKDRFNSLPPKAQEIIRKYTGKWMADKFLAGEVPFNTGAEKDLRADSNFTFTDPSPADLEVIRAAAKTVRDAWAEKSDDNRKFLQDVDTAIEKVKQMGAEGTDAAFLR